VQEVCKIQAVVTAGHENTRNRAAAVPINVHHPVWLSWWCCRQDTRHVVLRLIGHVTFWVNFV